MSSAPEHRASSATAKWNKMLTRTLESQPEAATHLADALPGLANRSIQTLASLTPAPPTNSHTHNS